MLRSNDLRALLVATSGCPTESAWHRSVMERLLAPSERSPRMIVRLADPVILMLRRCDWARARDWLREALMESPDFPQAHSLIRGIHETWTSEDREHAFLYVQRAEVSEQARTGALRMVAWHLEPRERVDFLFDVFEVGVLTQWFWSVEQISLPGGETADAFAARGAQSIAAYPDQPLAPRLLASVAVAAAREPGVSRSTALAVLRTIDELSHRPEFATGMRDAVARAARGGG